MYTNNSGISRAYAYSNNKDENNKNNILDANYIASRTSNVPFNYNGNNVTNAPTNTNPKIKYTIDYPKYQHIGSNDRDTTVYPSPNNYKICFEKKIKNIVEIELVNVILPNVTGILLEPYLIIEIDELPSNIEFRCNKIVKAFSILPLKKPNVDSGSFIIPELGQNYRTPMKLKNPIASLDSITISIKDLDGNLFNFGSDTSPTPTKALQNTFIFKFTTLEADTSKVIQTQALF